LKGNITKQGIDNIINTTIHANGNMITNNENIWAIKGATLSDKSARKEYKLTQDEIIKAINNGQLQYRINYVYENPYYKLIRAEVEELVEKKYGKNYLKIGKLKKELDVINKELRRLKKQTKVLENKKVELQIIINKEHNNMD